MPFDAANSAMFNRRLLVTALRALYRRIFIGTIPAHATRPIVEARAAPLA
jgi:hypothetical protein